ncbi:hypothetical protein IAR55_000825 [Kwoniella newhampshirensis]|uniref:Uncharacterized protein n=1 Tax=Kwoniella newhampshirensis TaxID=1651941 RepID=A0AAW0Z415_9TREE
MYTLSRTANLGANLKVRDRRMRGWEMDAGIGNGKIGKNVVQYNLPVPKADLLPKYQSGLSPYDVVFFFWTWSVGEFIGLGTQVE